MKKTLLAGLLSLLLGLVQAQEKGDFRLHFGGEFGTWPQLFFGMNGGVEYVFMDRLSVVPNYSRFFPEFGHASSLNLDTRYYFTEGALKWYGMGGFTNAWSLLNRPGVGMVRVNTQGPNLGFGGLLAFDNRLALNPELKYWSQREGRFIFTISMVYFLN
ncbi:MAG: hypothetical protein JJU34_10525 [Lunatimonas sp.]|uniref:hypothetical protein n=1 Tax=Lunatimonas sp. TaxID=2060141 RepID=UPI00263B8876|nr:hypothetical protein [Lunatimonas sp.]MCC5937708.1 hypothetical protein [Lunatimonas sp.]